jgi:sterol desaturase/sphingolipid hydroxylase (fatty acid hydroxylase superfamily)
MTSTTAMLIVIASGLFFGLIDLANGQFRKAGALSMKEAGINLFSFINFLGIRAAMILFWAWLLALILPGAKGFLLGTGFWTVFVMFTLVEEYVHYWVHRWSHTIPWLWRLHKPHHTPQHLNVGVSFRENWLWFMIIPNAPLGAILVLGGYPEIAAMHVAWKGASEFMVHTATRWDLPLYRFWLTRPIMLTLERVVTLQDTHHAHHGVGRYGHGMCNFGSFLFLFDVLHGTAEFPKHRQDGFGMPGSVKVEPWYEQLWWPLGRDKVAADLHPPSRNESQGNRTFGNGRFSITM